MSTLSDKLKEVEKKSKRTRWITTVLTAIMIIFLATSTFFWLQLKKSEEKLRVKTEEAEKSRDSIQGLFTKLSKAMDPDDYWNHIKKEGSNEAYINYITNKFKIDKSEYLPIAIETLTSTDLEGFEGWIFTGLKKNDGTYENRNIVEVIFRDGKEVTDPAIRNSEPEVGDIVKLIGKQNKNTYQRHNQSRVNELGWRNKTKAFVVKKWNDPSPNQATFEIYIKYY